MTGSSWTRAMAVLTLALGTLVVAQPSTVGAVPGQLTADQAFVTSAYHDFLGRSPTKGQLDAATATSLATLSARAAVVRGLSTSPEWVRTTVKKLYQDTLGRPGDASGVNYWVGKLSTSRLTVAKVATLFYSSQDYFDGFGEGENPIWVTDLYTKILLRNGADDPSGVGYWVDTTVSRGRYAVAYSFYQSDESRHTRVKALYQTLLGRAPDPGGWNFWANQITTVGDLALAANLASSEEYYARARTLYQFTPVGLGSLAAPRGVKSTSYLYNVPTVGGVAPLHFSAPGLPSGLAIDPATGSISGSPTTVGIFQVSVTVSDAKSTTATGHLQLVVDTIAENASWLTTVNAYRAASGLPLVTENPAWTAGLIKHLDYMANTPQSYYTGEYVSAHTANPASPWYSVSVADAAHRSELGGKLPTNRPAIEQWFAAPFHAIGLLRESLSQSAYAAKEYPSLSYSAAGVDVIRGLTGYGPPSTPIVFPGPDSTMQWGTPLGRELPDPTESCAAASPAGLPLIAMLPTAPPAGTTATLKTPAGSTLTVGSALCVVTASTYVSSDPVYGSTGQSILEGDNVVLVIPTTPLANGRYTATIDRPGFPPIEWSFWIIPSA